MGDEYDLGLALVIYVGLDNDLFQKQDVCMASESNME
jgi:hypothetical protein